MLDIVDLKLEDATLIHSNLGGAAGQDALAPPGTYGQSIRFGRVGVTAEGVGVDLEIQNRTPCENVREDLLSERGGQF